MSLHCESDHSLDFTVVYNAPSQGSIPSKERCCMIIRSGTCANFIESAGYDNGRSRSLSARVYVFSSDEEGDGNRNDLVERWSFPVVERNGDNVRWRCVLHPYGLPAVARNAVRCSPRSLFLRERVQPSLVTINPYCFWNWISVL